MRGHSWRSETMGRNGQRDRNNYHRGGVCCTVIKVCQSFNDFFKLFFIFYRICKNVLFWTFVQKSLVVIFKNNFGKNVSDSYFTCLNLNSGFLNFFFSKSEVWYSPICTQKPSGFFRGAFLFSCRNFYSKFRLASEKCGGVDCPEQSLVSSSSEGHERRRSAELQ